MSSTQSSPTSLTEQEIRGKFAQGLCSLLEPVVVDIDSKVQLVRISQVELKKQIDGLSEELVKINEEKGVPLDLEPYVKKLNNAKRRVMLVNNILQNVQERIGKLEHNIAKEAARRRTYLQQNPASGPAPPAASSSPTPTNN